MPRKPRFDKRKKSSCPDERTFLWFADEQEISMEALLASDIEIETWWMGSAEQVLDFFIGRHPCHRPSAWWRYETELLGNRQMVSGKGQLLSAIGLPQYQYHAFGIPTDLIVDPDDLPVYETEPAYLRRHNLLSKAELKLQFPETEIFTGRMFAFDSASGFYVAVADNGSERTIDMLKRLNQTATRQAVECRGFHFSKGQGKISPGCPAL